MFELNDRVRVKLHEPVGNPTTETANKYLRRFEGREGWILDRWYDAKDGYHYRVGFEQEAGHYQNVGIILEHELEAYGRLET